MAWWLVITTFASKKRNNLRKALIEELRAYLVFLADGG
jgi:hypothetical protein